MAQRGLSYRTRRRLALVMLAVGLPLYIVAAVTLVGMFERPAVWIELAVFVALGLVWALPFRFIFLGVGRDEPPAERDERS